CRCRSCSRTAVYAFTGTFTRPKEIEPLHIARIGLRKRSCLLHARGSQNALGWPRIGARGPRAADVKGVIMAQTATIAGRQLGLTTQDKVMYPATGATKGAVIEYSLAVAAVLPPLARGRPVTRKRWVHGVGTAADPGKFFFRKILEEGAPDWLPRVTYEHKTTTNTYPLAEEPAALAWFGQLAALELHVPQWRFDDDGAPLRPDRLVLDLDPGKGAGLAECVEVALLCKEFLDDMELAAVPVTSGSKGIHLYAALDGTLTSDDASAVA